LLLSNGGLLIFCQPIYLGFMTDREPFLDKAELAQALKCSTRTIENLVARDAVPFIRVGNRLRFQLSKVTEALTRVMPRKRGRPRRIAGMTPD